MPARSAPLLSRRVHRAESHRTLSSAVVVAAGLVCASAAWFSSSLSVPGTSAAGSLAALVLTGFVAALVPRVPSGPLAAVAGVALGAALFCIGSLYPGAGLIAAASWAAAGAWGLWRGPRLVPAAGEDTPARLVATRSGWLPFVFPVVFTVAFAYLSPDGNVTGAALGALAGTVLVGQHTGALLTAPYQARAPSSATTFLLSTTGLVFALVRFVRDERAVLAQEDS